MYEWRKEVTGMHHILCRRCSLKKSVVRQQRVLVGRMNFGGQTRRIARAEPRIKRWKPNEEKYNKKPREKVSQAVSEEEDGWTLIS